MPRDRSSVEDRTATCLIQGARVPFDGSRERAPYFAIARCEGIDARRSTSNPGVTMNAFGIEGPSCPFNASPWITTNWRPTSRDGPR